MAAPVDKFLISVYHTVTMETYKCLAHCFWHRLKH